MRHPRRVSGVVGVLAALAACGPSEKQSKAGQSQAESVASEPMSHDLGPFFHAEMEMKERVMEVEGTDVADSWLRKMIEHKRGAVELSNILLQKLPSGPVAEMAHATADKQTKEIAELQRLLRNGAPDHQSAFLYQPALAKMHDAMMEAEGVDLSEVWLRKMLAHHKGGVEMSNELLHQKDVPPAIRSKAEATRSGQHREIQMFEYLLRKERNN